MSNAESRAEAKPAGTRWWESYLVRYLSGFIVGTLCVAVIIAHALPTDKAMKVLGPALFVLKQDVSVVPPKVVSVKSITQRGGSDAIETAATFEVQDSGNAVLGIAIVALGVIYCYLASAPITVLHAGRMMLTWADRQARGLWLGWVLALVLTGALLLTGAIAVVQGCLSAGLDITMVVLSGIGLLALDPLAWHAKLDKTILTARRRAWSFECGGILPRWLDANSVKPADIDGLKYPQQGGYLLVVQVLLWAALQLALTDLAARSGRIHPAWFLIAIPAIWIGITQYWALGSLLLRPDEYTQFALRLAKARQNPRVLELRETYTHLREHANAIFIVVVELSLLALALGWMGSGAAGPVSAGPPEGMHMILPTGIAFVCFWLVPTLFMWARANALERDFQLDSYFNGKDADPPGRPAELAVTVNHWIDPPKP